jgi:predicted nucleic acid-binding protein
LRRLSVILDACVLYPGPLRDTLMHLSKTDLFKARWTDQISEEWIRNLEDKIPKDKLEAVKMLMETNLRDAKVDRYQHLIDTVELTDPDDRHVFSAAIHSKSDAIVTFNQKNFPIDYLKRFEVELIHPDDFIVYQFEFDAGAVLECFESQRLGLNNPKMDVDDFHRLYVSAATTSNSQYS